MIIALIKLMRLYYSLPLSLGMVVITAYILGGDMSILGFTIIPAFTALFCTISAGYVLNDICDVAVDAINCPARMMPAGRISRKPALIFSACLFTAGLTLLCFADRCSYWSCQ